MGSVRGSGLVGSVGGLVMGLVRRGLAGGAVSRGGLVIGVVGEGSSWWCG